MKRQSLLTAPSTISWPIEVPSRAGGTRVSIASGSIAADAASSIAGVEGKRLLQQLLQQKDFDDAEVNALCGLAHYHPFFEGQLLLQARREWGDQHSSPSSSSTCYDMWRWWWRAHTRPPRRFPILAQAGQRWPYVMFVLDGSVRLERFDLEICEGGQIGARE